MRNAEVPGQPLPAQIFWILTLKTRQFLRCRSRAFDRPGKSSLELRRQIKRLRRRHPRDDRRSSLLLKCLLKPCGLLWYHAIRKNVHNLAAEFFTSLTACRPDQQLLPGLLIKCCSMQFRTTNAPPAGHSCIGQKSRYELRPDQGLHVRRRDKILLHFTEHVRKVRQGSDQMSAAASGRTFAEYPWSLPNVCYADDCVTG